MAKHTGGKSRYKNYVQCVYYESRLYPFTKNEEKINSKKEKNLSHKLVAYVYKTY